MRSNQPLPDPIANAPEIPLGLGFFYKAFQELSSERMDGPIPGSAIRSYCRDEEITGELADDVKYHIRNLDNALLDYRRKKAEKENGGKT
ncbi:tail chaperonin [Roseobacter phage RDJL3]|jgi:hypothetical protein|nr:tail chaperonin [Roseobacter phage RDJL3]